MKENTLILCAALLGGSLTVSAETSTPTGLITTQTHFVGEPITAIKTSGGFDIEVRQGETTGVTLTIDTLLLAELNCTLHDGQLELGRASSASNSSLSKRGIMETILSGGSVNINGQKVRVDQPYNDGGITITAQDWASYRAIRAAHAQQPQIVLTVSSFEGLDMTGSGDVRFTTPVTGQNPRIVKTGSGDIHDLDLTATGEIRINSTGSGDLYGAKLNTPGRVEIPFNGSGNIDSLSVGSAQQLSIQKSGSSDFNRITLSDIAQVEVISSGSGAARIDGTAGTVVARHSGSGSIDLSRLTAQNIQDNPQSTASTISVTHSVGTVHTTSTTPGRMVEIAPNQWVNFGGPVTISGDFKEYIRTHGVRFADLTPEEQESLTAMMADIRRQTADTQRQMTEAQAQARNASRTPNNDMQDSDVPAQGNYILISASGTISCRLTDFTSITQDGTQIYNVPADTQVINHSRTVTITLLKDGRKEVRIQK